MRKPFQITTQAVRRGIVDVWNASMLVGASYDVHDIPFCPTTATDVPTRLVSWPEAKRLHNQSIRRGEKDYHVDAFIHFFIDDVKFDGLRSSVWLFPHRALKLIRHFDGIITPDFSMCQDFPEPIKLYAVYRMRAFGYWVGTQGIAVINNVRWGTKETWGYCFAGIPRETFVAVGSVASGLRRPENRALFADGLVKMAETLRPTTIIVYGSTRYEVFDYLRANGIRIVQFDSDTSKAFAREVEHEQD